MLCSLNRENSSKDYAVSTKYLQYHRLTGNPADGEFCATAECLPRQTRRKAWRAAREVSHCFGCADGGSGHCSEATPSVKDCHPRSETCGAGRGFRTDDPQLRGKCELVCGIAGFVDFAGHERADGAARVKRMADTLVHRGPDADGFYVDDYAALGHRRLSIIDLSGGHQPMGALDDRLQIVFNGEIYNYLDVRAELEQLGHRFRSRDRKSVILLSYAEWGEQCVQKLSGMFAFAIWDTRERRLF